MISTKALPKVLPITKLSHSFKIISPISKAFYLKECLMFFLTEMCSKSMGEKLFIPTYKQVVHKTKYISQTTLA